MCGDRAMVCIGYTGRGSGTYPPKGEGTPSHPTKTMTMTLVGHTCPSLGHLDRRKRGR